MEGGSRTGRIMRGIAMGDGDAEETVLSKAVAAQDLLPRINSTVRYRGDSAKMGTVLETASPGSGYVLRLRQETAHSKKLVRAGEDDVDVEKHPKTLEIVDSACDVYCCEHLRRFSTTKIYKVRLTAEENSLFDKESPTMEPLVKQMLVWRKSNLAIAAVCFVALFGWRWENFGQSVNKRTFYKRVGVADSQHGQNAVQGLWLLTLVVSCLNILVALVLAFSTACAARAWQRYEKSKKWTTFGTATALIFPFLIIMFIPYRRSVDFVGWQRDICLDAMFGNSTVAGGVVTQLHRVGATSLDNTTALCDEPSLVPEKVEAALTEAGVVFNSTNGTCRRADLASEPAVGLLTAQAKELCSSDTSPQPGGAGGCLGCFQCMPFVVMVRAYNYTLPVPVWSSGLSGEGLTKLKDLCLECITGALNCVDTCAPLYLAQSLAQMSSFGMDVCVSRDTLDSVKSFVVLLSYTEMVDSLVGLVYGMQTLLTALPVCISLMNSVIMASRVMKVVVPKSRVPGYLMAAAILFCFPLLMCIFGIVQQVVGNWWSCAAFVFAGAGMVVYFPFGDLTHWSGLWHERLTKNINEADCCKNSACKPCCLSCVNYWCVHDRSQDADSDDEEDADISEWTSASDVMRSRSNGQAGATHQAMKAGILSPQRRISIQMEFKCRDRLRLACNLTAVLFFSIFIYTSRILYRLSGLHDMELTWDNTLYAFWSTVFSAISMVLVYVTTSRLAAIFFVDFVTSAMVQLTSGDDTDADEVQNMRNDKMEQLKHLVRAGVFRRNHVGQKLQLVQCLSSGLTQVLYKENTFNVQWYKQPPTSGGGTVIKEVNECPAGLVVLSDQGGIFVNPDRTMCDNAVTA